MMIHEDCRSGGGGGDVWFWYGSRSSSIHLQLLMLFLYICKFNALITIDEINNDWKHSTHCSWYSSGGIDEKTIQKVNLTCSSGYFQWNDPIGGMHIRFLMNDTSGGGICLRIHFIQTFKVFYRISDRSKNHRFLNVTKEFQKCANTQIDVLLLIETYQMQIWKERIAGFRYEILPQSLIATTTTTTATEESSTSCSICSDTDIVNAFCNIADFVFEGHQSNGNEEIVIDKILRKPLHHYQLIQRRNTSLNGCLYKKDEINRIYIAKKEFDMVHIICSPTISHYMQIAQERSQNTPCQLL